MGPETKTSGDTGVSGDRQDSTHANADGREKLAEAAGKVSDATLAAAFEQIALERNDCLAASAAGRLTR